MGDAMGFIALKPRISVIIPAYNAAAYLPRAIESVLAQTWPAHEIIIVDDGSTDSTSETVKPYLTQSVPDVRYIHQVNAGPSAARNQGVALASGEWIAFLDADDWYYTGRLARHAHMIVADPKLDFLVGNFDYRDSAGALMHTSMTASALGQELLKRWGKNGETVIEGATLGHFMAGQFSDTRMLTLPRATFTDLGGFPLELKICEDVVFLLRLCACSQRVGIVCESGAVYSVHDAGLIRSDRLRAQTETVRALKMQASIMKNAPPSVNAAWRQLIKKAYLNLAYFLVKNGQRGAALHALGNAALFNPSLSDARHLFSIMRG
ncbi:MAG: glycosyltransferase [Thiobacillaceae bacterium]